MWTLDKSGNLEIFGTGAMANFGTDSTPWGSGIRTVTVKEGVTSIGQNAFAYCTKLSYIDLPEGVVSIGQSAFAGCTGLMTVVTRQGLTSVGTNAFMGCSKLRGAVLPAELASIGAGAFSGCTNFADLYYIGNKTDWEGITGSGTAGYSGEVKFAAKLDELAVLRVIHPIGGSFSTEFPTVAKKTILQRFAFL